MLWQTNCLWILTIVYITTYLYPSKFQVINFIKIKIHSSLFLRFQIKNLYFSWQSSLFQLNFITFHRVFPSTSHTPHGAHLLSHSAYVCMSTSKWQQEDVPHSAPPSSANPSGHPQFTNCSTHTYTTWFGLRDILNCSMQSARQQGERGRGGGAWALDRNKDHALVPGRGQGAARKVEST